MVGSTGNHTSPINKRLNFQFATKLEEPKKGLKVGYWGTRGLPFLVHICLKGFRVIGIGFRV